MANPVYPNIPDSFDPARYEIDFEDPAIATEMEGGYVVSRARHTRPPRRTWTIGYTKMKHADKLLLDAFYAQVRGGSTIFDWTNPETDTVHQVRLMGGYKPKYEGIGATKMWTFTLQLQEA